MQALRVKEIQSGTRLEVFTLIWMVIEMAVSVAAGVASGSILLIAFGLDSLIELISGAVLLWRLLVESRGGDVERVERVEHQATWMVAITLGLLCAYVLISAVYGLLNHLKPESSVPGIAVSVLAVLIMPYLALVKRRIAKRIESSALAGDAANSLTCAYMAGTVLVGLILNAFFGWWWVENVAALLFLIWLVAETREAFEEAGSAQAG